MGPHGSTPVHDQASSTAGAGVGYPQRGCGPVDGRKCQEIRLRAERRAERRAGEMLATLKRTPREESGKVGRDMQLGTGAPRRSPESPYQAALKTAQIDERTAREMLLTLERKSPQTAGPNGVKGNHRRAAPVVPESPYQSALAVTKIDDRRAREWQQPARTPT